MRGTPRIEVIREINTTLLRAEKSASYLQNYYVESQPLEVMARESLVKPSDQ